jgi:hypothetical protein
MMHNRQRLDPQPCSRDHTRVKELLRGTLESVIFAVLDAENLPRRSAPWRS